MRKKIMPNWRKHITEKNLGPILMWLAMAIFLWFGSTFASLGKDPEGDFARQLYRNGMLAMIYIPMFVLGAMWTIKKPRKSKAQTHSQSSE